MQDNIEDSKPQHERHPLVTVGLLTAGTQLGSALIQRLGRHPLLLFAMGAGVGVYSYKNRKEIIAEVEELKKQGEKLFSREHQE